MRQTIPTQSSMALVPKRSLGITRQTLVWLLLLVPAIIVVNLLALYGHGPLYHVDMGDSVDKLLIHNFHKTEVDHQGNSYRWSRADSRLNIRGFLSTPRAYLMLESGGLPEVIPAPRPLQLHIDDKPWTTLPVQSIPRRYMMLLPPSALVDGSLQVDFLTEVSKVKPDTRNLGIRLDSFTIGWFPELQIMPTWRLVLVQWLLIVGCLGLAFSLDMPRWSFMVITILLLLALALMTGFALLFAFMWQIRLLATLVATLILLYATFPLLHRLLPSPNSYRELRWLWGIVIVAIAIRMVPILYPPFESHDWYIHRKRIVDFVNGAFLIYDKPAEFSKKLTIVPPAPYLFYSPFLLFTKNPIVAMQWVYTFIDCFTTLMVGILVRFTGGKVRTSLLAALIVAFFPLNFTALWWGFGPQVIGQMLVVFMALFLAHNNIRTKMVWLSAGLVFSLLLLSHVGAGILGGFTMATYVGISLIMLRNQRSHWKPWAILMIASGIFVILLIYSRVIAMQLNGLASNDRLAWDADDVFRVKWTLLSLYPSFQPIGVAFSVASLAFFLYSRTSFHRWIVLAWYGSAMLFFVVDLAFGLQVRYAYFVVPLLAAGVALMLDRWMTRHRFGWILAACIIGLIGVRGIHLWYEGIFLGIKPSLRGLTH